MFGLRSAQGRAIVAGALGLLLLAGVGAVAGMAATTDQTGRSTLWLVIGLSAAAFLIAAGAVAMAIVSVVRPLAALRASARAIAAGDPEARADVSGPEEIASLARDFNAMTDALSAKTKEYIDTTNLTGVLILRVDKDNRVSLVNDAKCEFLGRSREEILGTPILDYLHPADAPSTIRAIRKMVRSKGLVTGIVSRHVTPMGTRVTEWSGYPIFDEEGRYAGVHGTGRDISERKWAEEALRESEARYRLLADNAADVIWTMDTNLRVTYVSPSVTRLRGYTVQEVMGQTLKQMLTSASLKVAKKAIAAEQAIEESEEKDLTRSRTVEVEQTCKDGSTVWVEVKFAILRDPDGQAIGTMGITRDITERKRAEVALRESEGRFSTLAGAPFEGLVIHERGNILDANPAFATMFGYELFEVIGMHALDFTASQSRDLLWQGILSRRKEPFEALGLRKDGSTLVCELRGKDIPYQERMVTVTAVRDITERKRAEDALQKVREDIESRVERRAQEVNGYGLTFRELTVLHLVAGGKADKEIATVLGISPLTAHKHLSNILDKMGAASRTEAGVRAIREGLLDYQGHQETAA